MPDTGAPSPADDTQMANEPRHRHPWPGTRLPNTVRSIQRGVAARGFVLAHNRRLSPAARTIHFFPMRPDPEMRMGLIAARLGLRIGTTVRRGEPTIAWDTGTWFSAAALRRLPDDAINRNCTDISKGNVDRVWAEVAGYSVAVDPLTWEGPMVVKSEFNGRHDGRIVRGPIAATHPGYVYQRFVDATDGDQLVDLRTAIIGREIPVLMLRAHSRIRWFDTASRSTLADPDSEFSPAERGQLLRFAALIGFEYGELDVLRDKASGRIYVLDANRTPQGPAGAESPSDAQRATQLMADAFGRLMADRWP